MDTERYQGETPGEEQATADSETADQERETEGMLSKIYGRTVEFLENHPDLADPLPNSVKRSLLVAIAALGISVAPEIAQAQSAEAASLFDKLPKIEHGIEVGGGAGDGMTTSFVASTEASIGKAHMELGGKINFGRGIFVPDSHPDVSGAHGAPAFKNGPVTGFEIDSATDVAEKGNFSAKALAELHHEESGTAWFFGGQGEYKLPRGLTAYANTGKYIDFTSKTGKGGEPGYRTKAGLQAEFQSFLKFLPSGTAYVELGGPGREKGFTIGITKSFGGKKEEEKEK